MFVSATSELSYAATLSRRGVEGGGVCSREIGRKMNISDVAVRWGMGRRMGRRGEGRVSRDDDVCALVRVEAGHALSTARPANRLDVVMPWEISLMPALLRYNSGDV